MDADDLAGIPIDEIVLLTVRCAERLLPLYEARNPGDDRPARAIRFARFMDECRTRGVLLDRLTDNHLAKIVEAAKAAAASDNLFASPSASSAVAAIDAARAALIAVHTIESDAVGSGVIVHSYGLAPLEERTAQVRSIALRVIHNSSVAYPDAAADLQLVKSGMSLRNAPIWSGNEPEWHAQAVAETLAARAALASDPRATLPVTDPDSWTSGNIGSVLAYLTALYMKQGGSGGPSDLPGGTAVAATTTSQGGEPKVIESSDRKEVLVQVGPDGKPARVVGGDSAQTPNKPPSTPHPISPPRSNGVSTIAGGAITGALVGGVAGILIGALVGAVIVSIIEDSGGSR